MIRQFKEKRPNAMWDKEIYNSGVRFGYQKGFSDGKAKMQEEIKQEIINYRNIGAYKHPDAKLIHTICNEILERISNLQSRGNEKARTEHGDSVPKERLLTPEISRAINGDGSSPDTQGPPMSKDESEKVALEGKKALPSADTSNSHTCEFCGTTYPDFDKTVVYYSVNVFGKDRIICNECKSRLKLIKSQKVKGK